MLFRQCNMFCTFPLTLSAVSVQCPIRLFLWFLIFVLSRFVVQILVLLLLLLLSSSSSSSLVTGLFCLVLLLNQRWSPPLRLQASRCSTFHIMCDVPSIAVFCSESIECFLGTASKFFLKLLVTIPVAPNITSTIVHFSYYYYNYYYYIYIWSVFRGLVIFL